MVTSAKPSLARIRASVATASASTRAPAWRDMKAKTVNSVSPSLDGALGHTTTREEGDTETPKETPRSLVTLRHIEPLDVSVL